VLEHRVVDAGKERYEELAGGRAGGVDGLQLAAE